MKFSKSSNNAGVELGSTFLFRLRQGKQGKKSPNPLILPTKTLEMDSSFVGDFPLVLQTESRQMIEFNYSPNFTRPSSTYQFPNFSQPRRSSSLSLQSTSSAFTITSYATTPLSTPRLVEDNVLEPSELLDELENYFDQDLVLFFAPKCQETDSEDDREQLGFAEMLAEGEVKSATEASGRVASEWRRVARQSSDVMDWDMTGILSRKQGEEFLDQARVILESEFPGNAGIEQGLRRMGF